MASVDHKLLEGGVGYVRLKQFQANTTADLEAALTDMKKSGELKGLVLDLRGNPGGLLDQAAKVVDTFISDGPIVATVGNPSEGREEKVAHADGTEPNYPLAVLVNGSSASASEIVTGSLKNHERAVIIGDTTFGKGSVQLVFTDLPDKAALKLTIAQYLTEPGDVSIQGVGVTPDIELDPMTADSLEMDLTADSNGIKERDLSRALSNVRAKDGGRPMELVKYDLPIKDRLAERDRGGDLEENFELDFAIQFARGFVTHVQPGKRTDQVRQAKQYISDTRHAEVERLAEELKGFGIDWSDAPADVPAAVTPTPAPGVEVKFETDRPNNEVTAGDPINLKLTVTNHGTSTLYRLFGVTKSENPMFENKQLVIGQARAGQIAHGRGAGRLVRLQGAQGGLVRAGAEGHAEAMHRAEGRADALGRGEAALRGGPRARSRGRRASRHGQIARSADLRVLVRGHRQPPRQRRRSRPEGRGRDDVPDGEERRQGALVRDDGQPAQPVGRGPAPARRALRPFEHDAGRHEARRLHLRRRTRARGSGGEGGAVDPRRRAPGGRRREGADPDRRSDDGRGERRRRSRGTERRGSAQRADAVRPGVRAPSRGERRERAGNGQRVREALPGRGAVRVRPRVGPGARRRRAGRRSCIEDSMGHAPPALEIPQPQLATRDPHTLVHGMASDDARLLDTFIFVGSRKVFYRSNRTGPDLKKMSFDADLPLRPGVNVVTIVARENPDTTTRRTYVVRRDGPNGELLPTPKTDDELSETASADDD